MTDWKDCTSYSQGEKKDGRVPRTWEITLGGVRLVVTRYLSLDGWWMLCREYGVNEHVELIESDIEVAKRMALHRFILLASDARLVATQVVADAEELIEYGR